MSSFRDASLSSTVSRAVASWCAGDARWKPVLAERKAQRTATLEGIRTGALEECAGTAAVLGCGLGQLQESLMQKAVGGLQFAGDHQQPPHQVSIAEKLEEKARQLELFVRQLEEKDEELKAERQEVKEDERCVRHVMRLWQHALDDERSQFRQELEEERCELDQQSQRLEEGRQELREDERRLRQDLRLRQQGLEDETGRLKRELEERRHEIEEESHQLEVERFELLKERCVCREKFSEEHHEAECFNEERNEHQREIEKACQEVQDEERCMRQDLSLRQQGLEHRLNMERHELLNELREEHHHQTRCFNDERRELLKELTEGHELLNELREERDEQAQCFTEECSEHQRELVGVYRFVEEEAWEFDEVNWEANEDFAEREQQQQGFERRLGVERRELHESRESLEKGQWELKEEEQLLMARFEDACVRRTRMQGGGAAGEKAKAHVTKLCACEVYKAAERAFASIGIDERLIDRLHDRCYCSECYPSTFGDVIKNDGPQPYVVPRGWVRFGLKVPVHAEVHDIWKKWCVSFHGTKLDVAQCIVKIGEFLMPGDTLPDGSVLGSVNCAGRTDQKTYTSPTVNYAGLAVYARPTAIRGGSVPWPFGDRSKDQMFQVVFQCRQKPGTFKIQAETMGFRKQKKTDLCPHVPCDKIEWVSETRKSIIPYGLLIRTFQRSSPPERYFRSPVDNGLF